MINLYPIFVLKGANEYQDNVSVLKRFTKIATHPTLHRRNKHKKGTSRLRQRLIKLNNNEYRISIIYNQVILRNIKSHKYSCYVSVKYGRDTMIPAFYTLGILFLIKSIYNLFSHNVQLIEKISALIQYQIQKQRNELIKILERSKETLRNYTVNIGRSQILKTTCRSLIR